MWMRMAIAVGLGVQAASASAGQLDPLLFLKDRPKPNVILAIETTSRMQMDARGSYRDPHVYRRTGADWETPLGVGPAHVTATYRRKFVGLRAADGGSHVASSIAIVGDADPDYGRFDGATRLQVARLALVDVVARNLAVARFGLVKTRQVDPNLSVEPGTSVRSEDPAQQVPTETGVAGTWLAVMPGVAGANGSVTGSMPALVRAEAGGANEEVQRILWAAPGEAGALLPAGLDPVGGEDAPLGSLLDDARAEAARLIGLDSGGVRCRNTVVVLIVGGGDGQTAPSADLAARAATYLDVGGHRVPIYVVAVAPRREDVPALRAIAAAAGGQYVEVASGMIDRVEADGLVPEVARAVNCAVQHGLASAADVNVRPSPGKPYGLATEHQLTGPVVGTINLRGAVGASGAVLPGTAVTSPSSQALIPQRSNVMISAGFALPGDVGTPGFPGRMSAFRLYRPAADPSRPSGYRFVADGTPLWFSSIPPPAARNIFTATPEGTIVPFTTASAGLLAPWLRTPDPALLIDEIRSWPLGAVIDSTPAVLDAPSLDPPPDGQYPAFAEATRHRRGLVFVGASDGMLHAFDGRLGVEVWAFIPFNLLPRLRSLRRGQAPGAFEYFVDASPKVADIRTSRGWRTWLVVGEGAGGTFYQALDVTLADISGLVGPDDDNVSALLSYFSRPDRITLAWSFPDYRHFDTSVDPYGDVREDAPEVEKTVGETWSAPVIAEMLAAPGRHVVLTGSGFYSHTRERRRGRFPSSNRHVGTTFYMLDAETGGVLDSRDVGSNGEGEETDDCASSGDCGSLKNALQADVVATGRAGSRRISTAYAADLDGRLWRFTIGTDGTNARLSGPERLHDAGRPIFSLAVAAGRASPYIFFGTLSDRLPARGAGSAASTIVGLLDDGVADGRVTFALSLADAGEDEAPRLAATPVVAGDVVFFAAATTNPPPSCASTDSSLYAVTFEGGAAYDSNGDATIDDRDPRKVVTWRGTRVIGTRVVDRHLVVGTSQAADVFGDQQDYNAGALQSRPRVLSWRLVR